MTSKETFFHLMHLPQIALSIYGLRHSYTAITNLQKYEATTKKLSKWSDTVGQELYKTQTTQTTGALATLLSLLTSLTLLLAVSHLPPLFAFIANPLLLLLTLAARTHIKNYWTPRTGKDGKPVGGRVPLPNFEDYNVACRSTEDLLEVLKYLEYSWVITSLVSGFKGFH